MRWKRENGATLHVVIGYVLLFGFGLLYLFVLLPALGGGLTGALLGLLLMIGVWGVIRKITDDN